MLSASRSSSPSRLTRFQGDLKSISNSNLSLNLGVISQSRSISKRNYTRSVSRRNLNVRTASELALQKSLILEVLNAQPSLRDSKSYLNSFAPRKSNQNGNGNGRVTHSNPINPTFTSPQHWNHQRPNHPPPAPIPLAPHHHDPTPSLHPTTTSTSTSSTTTTLTETTLPNISLSDTIESSVASPIQQHTAIVKIQGPFTNRQLASIADGMVYLKKLGLVSVIVMDSEDWIDNSPSFASEDGRWLQSGTGRNSQDDFDREAIKPWLSRNENQDQNQENKNGINGQDIKGKGKMRGNEFKGEEKFDSKKLRTLATLRKRMLNDTYRLTELLIEKGANALPFQRPIMKVDPIGARKAHLESLSYSQSNSHPESLQDQSSSSSSNINIKSSTYNPNCFSSSSTNKKRKSKFSLDNPSSSFDSRSPLISDDSLKSLRSSLALDQIPILAPFALYSDPDQNGAERSIPVKADDLMVGLARDMANYGRKMEEKLRERERLNELMKENNGVEDEEDVGSGSEFGGIDDSEVDMTPLRLMVINREGGIPSHARGGNPHLAINLASESSHIENSFIWNQTHPTALSNLKMVSDCLSYMPQTSSGVVVSHRSPRSLIANLITNKAAHSPSLPHSLLASKKDVRHTPTIIRPGLDVKVLENFDEIDQEKMKNLLEEAFNRELDFENYFSRLKKSLDFVIITGDYSGAAIVTKEFSPNDDRENSEPIAYLDKFAVLPSLQGSGTVDFLWGALRDEVQGLGLLDSINENGGKEGRGKGRDLVWKSRSDNPVNRWYYERSNGFMKIDTQAKKVQDGNGVEEEQIRTPAWSMFWCDSEERISEMAGERKLKAEASREDVIENMNNSHLHDDLWSISKMEKERRNLERQDELDQEIEEKVNGSSKRRVREHLEEERYSEEEDLDENEDFDEREWNKKTSGNKRNRISRKDLRKALEAYGRDLKDTDPSSSSSSTTVSSEIINLFSNNQKLLPIIAPEEEGRLQRWAACMATIPSAWK